MRSRPLGPTVLAGAVATATLMLTGCSSLFGKPAGKGDPANQRLHQLAADPTFSALPPGAEHGGLKLTRARSEPVVFFGGGWHGPSVVRTFESSATPLSVYEFYGELARAGGWSVVGVGALHVPSSWHKTYPNGAVASLLLFTPRPLEPASGPRQYQLQRGITLPS